MIQISPRHRNWFATPFLIAILSFVSAEIAGADQTIGASETPYLNDARVGADSDEATASTDKIRTAQAGLISEQNKGSGPTATPFRDLRADGTVCPECPEMVMIPSGTFLMGSPTDEAGRFRNEGPQHQVSVRQFAIGAYEVTFAEWDVCVADGGCRRYSPRDKGWGRGRMPVLHIGWRDARAYVSWLSQITAQEYRLPSEAEWEYAARAGTATRFNFGDEISKEQANFGNNVGRTLPVGSYPGNSFGVFDVHGNVWEWIEDCWHEDYVGAPTDGNVWDCTGDVVRGGSLDSRPRIVRSANRFTTQYSPRLFSFGLRVAKTISSNE